MTGNKLLDPPNANRCCYFKLFSREFFYIRLNIMDIISACLIKFVNLIDKINTYYNITQINILFEKYTV